MQALQGLLFNRLHTHGANVRGAGGFEQGGRVGGVRLVAPHVGTHVLGGQQANGNTQAIEPTRPVVRRAAGFHDHQGYRSVGEPALELGAGEALGFNDAPLIVGGGDLENGFGQVDGHGSSMHLGLLSFVMKT
ncbi:hypothetical protein D9M69_559260 [compost metagenome]